MKPHNPRYSLSLIPQEMLKNKPRFSTSYAISLKPQKHIDETKKMKELSQSRYKSTTITTSPSHYAV
jgi:hypothetical protein